MCIDRDREAKSQLMSNPFGLSMIRLLGNKITVALRSSGNGYRFLLIIPLWCLILTVGCRTSEPPSMARAELKEALLVEKQAKAEAERAKEAAEAAAEEVERAKLGAVEMRAEHVNSARQARLMAEAERARWHWELERAQIEAQRATERANQDPRLDRFGSPFGFGPPGNRESPEEQRTKAEVQRIQIQEEQSRIRVEQARSEEERAEAEVEQGKWEAAAVPAARAASAERLRRQAAADLARAMSNVELLESRAENKTIPPINLGALDILWNFWAEARTDTSGTPTPRFEPSLNLKPNSTYLLALDLSSISYGTAKEGVLARLGGEAFREQLDRWIEGNERNVSLKVLALPDPAYFQRETARPAKILTVNLDKLRAIQNQKRTAVPVDAFNVLRETAAQNSDPDFFLGRVSFWVKTGSREGNASIAFSIWVDNEEIGASRPVDEISVSFCITASAPVPAACLGVHESQYGLRGIDSLRLANEKTTFPDAALHFVQLSSDRPLIGVFKRNDKPEGYKVWTLRKTASELTKFLSETQFNVSKKKLDKDLLFHGQELYNTLFPPDDDEDRQIARTSLEAFFREQRDKKSTSLSSTGASLYVRLINQGEVLPLGLMAIPTGTNSAEFLGFNFRIETPLPTQTYESSSECISQWAIVVPPETGVDATLAAARMQAVSVIEQKWRPLATPYTVMQTFGRWLGGMDENGDKDVNAIVVLSHHAKNTLSFNEDDSITSSSVARRFKRPALAILNGCGTAQPGAEEFIKELNFRGVSTVIATSTEVEPALAGDFFNCLNTTLETHAAHKDVTVSQLYYESLSCLKGKAPSEIGAQPYGARALKYALLGNGSLRLCSPKKKVNP